MKWFALGGLLILLTGSIWLITDKKSDIPAVTIKSEPEVNQYTIEGLKKRSYDSSIQKKRLIAKYNTYEAQVVSFVSDGLTEYAEMDIPSGNKPAGGWPVVIINHGHINPGAYSTETSYAGVSKYFAENGFMVFKPDYRGHDKSQGDPYSVVSRIGYSVDVLNLMAGVEKMPEINNQRIYMWGHSMGGDVTLRVLEVTNHIAAASLWAPAVTEFPENMLYFIRKEYTQRANEMMTEFEKLVKPEDYTKVGSFYNTNLVKIPLNLQQSITDESVPFTWGQQLAKKFDETGVEYTFYKYPNDNHNIAGHWFTALARDAELFDKKQR